MAEKVSIDIIILSFAKDEQLKNLTIQTIDTVLASEKPEDIHFNIVVIESNNALKPYQFENSVTIYPGTKFGFNKFLNIGIRATSNKYVCLCNNDLIFNKGWASEMLNFINGFGSDIIVTSPFCEKSHVNFKDAQAPLEGYFGYFAGHCFFTTRETLALVGPLDEKINFWYSDSDFLELMAKYNIKHYLLPNSKVYHLGSKATAQFWKLDFLRYTHHPNIYFCYKWRDKNIVRYYLRLLKYRYTYLLYLMQEKLAANSHK